MVLKGRSQKRGWRDGLEEEEIPRTVRSAAELHRQLPSNATIQPSIAVAEGTSVVCKSDAEQGKVHDADADTV
jgi:sulfur carrier protein ThiS